MYAFYSDSAPSEATLGLEGVWIHDPTDPEGTVHQFLYGANSRSTTIDIGGTSLVFAGRRYPVTEFGEHQDDQYSISVQVPHGAAYRSGMAIMRGFSETRQALVLRDNRGRAACGTMSGYSETDQGWGSEIAFTFTRVDVEVVEA